MSINIHVLIPSFNCASWIGRCLDSVAIQHHRPAQVLVIDDASTDPAYPPLVQQLLQSRDNSKPWQYHRNDVNRKCPYNLRLGIKLLDPSPEDVIFLLDGDDFLPDAMVFSRIAEVYADPACWLTYGNYSVYPKRTNEVPASAYTPKQIAKRCFRDYSAFNHPLTFRRFLWDQLTDADLQTADGRWFTGGYDYVIMVPMLEMAAPDHFRFLDEDLYVYNAENPQSDALVNAHLCHEAGQINKRPLKPRYIRI